MLKRKLSYEAVVWALQATNRYCRWLGNRLPSARNRCRFEIQKMKITTKSQIEKLLPEPKPNKVTNAHCYYFRPTIGNTFVTCWPLSRSIFFLSRTQKVRSQNATLL